MTTSSNGSGSTCAPGNPATTTSGSGTGSTATPASNTNSPWTYGTAYNPGGFISINIGGFGASGFGDIPFPELIFDPIIIKQKKVKVGNAEGYECTDCKDFYPMAELNQPDGVIEYVSFTCYGCRKGLKTFFEKVK